MKQKIFIASLLLLNIVAHAQTGSTFYGMARNATSSTDIFLATVNPATGVVTNIGTTPVGTNINLTGAALDPYNNNFYYVGGTDIKTVNLTTGAVTNTATLYSSTAGSYFDNYRFNNSDTTLYGLARTVTYDTDGTVLSTGVGLATVNTATGLISVLSATPVAAGFSMGGTAIDPYQKVFYFTNGLNFIGIDMYDGSLFSSVPITITDGVVFDNIAYSCADTTIYGLIRQNYYDTTYDAADSSIVFINVDSTTIHLGKIDPSTGIVTTISPYSIASGGYSLNAGATIDPSATVYYYNNGSELVGVSLATGLVVSNPTLSNTDGEYFDLMRIHSNCITATTPIRGRTVTGINGPSINSGCSIYPNPATNSISIRSNTRIRMTEVIDMLGHVVYSQTADNNPTNINLGDLTPGAYFVKCYTTAGVFTNRILKQ